MAGHRDPIAARIAQIALESKARVEAGMAVMGSTAGARAAQRRRGRDLQAGGAPTDEDDSLPERTAAVEASLAWAVSEEPGIDPDAELSPGWISKLSSLITDLLASKAASFSTVIEELQGGIWNELLELILLSRPAKEWAKVLRDVMLRVPVHMDLTFKGGALRLLRHHVSLYEAVRSMGPSWGRVAVALQALAQERLFCSCTLGRAPWPVPLESLLQGGASLMRTDSHGRVPAHTAALGSGMLGRLVQEAPVTLLLQDESGHTPLSLAAVFGLLADGSPEGLLDAALGCLASFPERTARVLGAHPPTASAWATLAQAGGGAALLAAWDADFGSVCTVTEAAAEEREGLAAARLRQRAQRVAVLGAAAAEREQASAALEPEELRLRLAHAEAELRAEREAAARRAEEHERELKRLRGLVAQREDDLLAAQSQAAARAAPPPAAANGGASEDGGRDAGRAASAHAPQPPTAGPRDDAPAASRERAVVEELRRSRLADVELAALPEELRKGVAAMQTSLRAAVERLSQDLYESEAHFLPELLQNADDNSYDPGVVPSVSFVLRRCGSQQGGRGGPDAAFLFSVNNERGLTEVDVCALCDISRSSKSASDGKTIGYKGIGWKSVFCVSDTPHVLSHGWRFRFNARGLGMLTPEWVEDAAYRALPEEVRKAHCEGNTVVYLPLRDLQALPGIEAEMTAMAADPAQLLFLRRLREVRLCGHSGAVRLAAPADGQGESRTATVREEEGGEEPLARTDFAVCSRGEVTVAMPLVAEPQAQRIFAFLPVRTVGFHFAVQAAFHLTASRAELHLSPENARRRNLVAPAFLEACRANESVGALALKYLGVEPAEPFWLPVYEAILVGLKGIACVETESGPAEPGMCILRGEDRVASWVSAELLWAACGLKFVSANCRPQVLRDLGVETFSFTHLLACLRHDDFQLPKCMWQSSSRSAFFSDVFSSLTDAMREDPSRLDSVQALAIFPVMDSGATAWATADRLHASPCPSMPQGWQTQLIWCLDPGLELCLRGWRLLELLGVGPAGERALEEAAVERLLGAARAGGAARSDRERLWAALAVLCRCFVQGRDPPVAWRDLKGSLLLPSCSGELLPTLCLQLWSFCGVELRLPKDVIDSVTSFAGLSWSASRVELERVATPVLEESVGSNLEWEVFLSALGVVPVNPTGPAAEGFLEATLQLGDVLGSGDFWREAAKSAPTLQHLERLLGPGAVGGEARRMWLRRLPVHLQGETNALEDLFLLDTFHSLAGEHLPYMQGAPSHPQVRALLRHLGVSTDVDRASLLKCLRCLRAHDVQDLGLAGEIYRRLGELDFTSPGGEELILVPGRGYLPAGDCTWLPFRTALLQRCCRLEPLKEFYGRFGSSVESAIERWVRNSPEQDAGELCEALLQAIHCAKADPGKPYCPIGKVPIQPVEAVEGLFAVARAAISDLAELCSPDSALAEGGCVDDEEGLRAVQAHSNAAFGYFVEHRMIVLPSLDVDGPQCILLSMGEAYWSVHPDLVDSPCADYALGAHYGSSPKVRQFFTEVLRVRPELTWQDSVHLFSSASRGQPPAGHEVAEGLRWIGGRTHARSQGELREPFDADRAAAEALDRARASGPPAGGHDSQPQAEPCEQQRGGAAGGREPRASAPSPPREWQLIGRLAGFKVFGAGGAVPSEVLYPDGRALQLACSAFGLHPLQVAFAFDPSGRCVCEEQLFLDIMQVPRAERLPSAEAVLTFWAAEVAHAIAHGATGPRACEELLQVQSTLLVTALEGLRQHGSL